MNRKVVGGSVGVVMIAGGALIAWGGLTGTLAAILAAFFAPSQLVRISGATSTDIPPALTPPPSEGASPGQAGGGSQIGPGTPSGSSPPAEIPGPLPPSLPGGDVPALPPFDIPALLP